jgi:uncharacterized protein (DUF3820 family)
MVDPQVYRTRELADRPAEYVVWFRQSDGSKLTIEMSLAGLIQLQGLVNRAVASLGGAVPDEMNAYPHVSGDSLQASAGAGRAQ